MDILTQTMSEFLGQVNNVFIPAMNVWVESLHNDTITKSLARPTFIKELCRTIEASYENLELEVSNTEVLMYVHLHNIPFKITALTVEGSRVRNDIKPRTFYKGRTMYILESLPLNWRGKTFEEMAMYGMDKLVREKQKKKYIEDLAKEVETILLENGVTRTDIRKIGKELTRV